MFGRKHTILISMYLAARHEKKDVVKMKHIQLSCGGTST